MSVDILRGLVIVIMGLDHVRDFFSPTLFAPEDPTVTTPAWFFTRWITHFCAPVFVFLAGTSAYLYSLKVSKMELSRFLWSRGAWLILIEFTVVNFVWKFTYFDWWFVQVIATIGIAMMLMGVLIHTPKWFLFAFAGITILGHNLLDNIHIDAYWWQLLHESRWVPPVFVVYPQIPWPGVMVFGYLAGHWFTQAAERRKRNLVWLGLAMSAGFIVLRFINVYGDPHAWSVMERGSLYTFLDFLNTTKYPPSLLYLLMTLGPAVVVLAYAETWKGKIADFFLVFGRVPFFYYVMHLLVGHVLAILYNGLYYNEWRSWLFDNPASWPTTL
ncbi:MAG: DUF1624 domain-containing protein [Bacteroidia bacterium]|nr:DUF1624 domain-containing protein [Bacteroidia bacterium]